jgi:hypothetical protein
MHNPECERLYRRLCTAIEINDRTLLDLTGLRMETTVSLPPVEICIFCRIEPSYLLSEAAPSRKGDRSSVHLTFVS